MSQPEEFKRRKRTRVGGPSQQGRLLGVVVFLSALLLATMVLTASLDLPPPAATLPTPTPDLAAAAPRLYLVGTYIERDASIPRLAALDLATRQPIYSLDNVRDAALSADGRRLYTLETNRVTALATATKQTLWRLDLAPLAATDDQPPTLLALTPDQKTLLIYRQELDFAANSARAWIEQVDVGTHQPNALNINIATPHVVETIEIAADGHTLFLVGYNAISGLDLRDGTQTQLVAAPSGGLGAVLSADRLRLFVVDREGWIAEYDTLSQRVIQRVRLQDPELAPVGGSASLALAPHSDRLALLVSQRGTPTIVRGELVEETSGQALIVVSLDDGTLVRRSARSHYAQPLAWSGAGEQIYFVEFGQVYRWQIGADRVYLEQSLGSDATITVAGQSGSFQLNVMLPVIAWNLLESIRLLANVSRALADGAIAGFTVNDARLSEALERNPILVTALNPVIGYEKGAAIAKQAYAEGRPILEMAQQMTDLPPAELAALLDPRALTNGGILGGGAGGSGGGGGG